jgi:hypothetical protein
MGKVGKIIAICLALIIVLGIASFISYSKFNVWNPFSTINGLIQVPSSTRKTMYSKKYGAILYFGCLGSGVQHICPTFWCTQCLVSFCYSKNYISKDMVWYNTPNRAHNLNNGGLFLLPISAKPRYCNLLY